MWDDQWTVFGERLRVVRYDLRGFGRSEAEPVPYSDLDDLLALLNFLDIERAHLVGHSMFGMVLVHFTLAHPSRVHRLVTADCGPSGLTGPVDALSHAEELAVAGRLAEAQENWLANAVFTPAASDRSSARDCSRLSRTTRGGAPGIPVYGVAFSRQRWSASTRFRRVRW